MNSYIKISLIISCLLIGALPTADAKISVEFEFLTTEDEKVGISTFYDNPVLIEWAASWCSVCKNNQEAIDEIYPEYKDRVNFVSISFALSDDTIEEVQQMKNDRGYEWTFGLDTEGYSSSHNVFNGYNWLIDSNGTLLKTWNGSIVTASDLTGAFEEYLGLENTRDSEELIVGSNNHILVPITTFVLITSWRRSR